MDKYCREMIKAIKESSNSSELENVINKIYENGFEDGANYEEPENKINRLGGTVVCVIDGAEATAHILRIPKGTKNEEELEEWLDTLFEMTNCNYQVVKHVALNVDVR